MSTIPTILAKKADKKTLSDDEIDTFMKAVYERKLEPAQIGAFLMAVYINGMVSSEVAQMTKSMVHYGKKLSWPKEWQHLVIDKHSTGGVGDKISLILAPVLAACGAKVPMISGRGLGITGGTIDKLESIKGYSAELDETKMLEMLETVGYFIATQTPDIAPIDKVLYATRDITATVASLPLITASIMSKKCVEGLTALIIDVKYGRATFMKTEAEAEELAKAMIQAGESFGTHTICVLDRMDHPIGRCSGNAVEVADALQALNGDSPDDQIQLVIEQGSLLLFTAKLAESLEEGKEKCQNAITSGAALAKFRDMMIGQGVERSLAETLCKQGKYSVSEYVEILGHSPKFTTEISAEKSGYIHDQDACKIGEVNWSMGAGRSCKTDIIEKSVGVILIKKVGDFIETGEVWAQVCHSEELTDRHRDVMNSAIKIHQEKPASLSLITKHISIDDC